ncbi:MAG: nucleoside phosphorylase [Desulfobacterales bacterium]|nr:MAG: nucleoside phosphorylase [Desulfobacterales bacterium]
MPNSDAVINPVKGTNDPTLGPVAVLVVSQADLNSLCGRMTLDVNDYRPLFTSRLFVDPSRIPGVAIIGPFIGAPYAVMLLETLVAWGACKFVFWGWCGAVSTRVKIGDIVIPTAAMIDEGTSRHYLLNDQQMSRPSARIGAALMKVLKDHDHPYHQGRIWSTDAVFRETRGKIEYYQRQDVLAVEMELSALFTVASFRQVELGALLVVSDEVSTFRWHPGFKQERFKQGRWAACQVVNELCQILSIPPSSKKPRN